MSGERVKLLGITIETTEFEEERTLFDQAVKDDRLEYEYDTHLSDMDGETLIIDTEAGAVHNPYGRGTDLLKLLRPILDRMPTHVLSLYLMDRRSREREAAR